MLDLELDELLKKIGEVWESPESAIPDLTPEWEEIGMDDNRLDLWGGDFWQDPETQVPTLVARQTTSPADVRSSERVIEEGVEGAAAFRAAEEMSKPKIKRWFKQENGRLDTDRLAPVGGGHMARPDVAQAFKAMRRSAKKDGVTIAITDSYRTYDQQVALKAQKPTLAATPGHSNHGWGLAFDINVNDPAVYNWLKKNGKRFGFEQPMSYEPWHWEYEGGYDPPNKKKGDKQRRATVSKPDLSGYKDVDMVAPLNPLVTIPLAFAGMWGERNSIDAPQVRASSSGEVDTGGLGFVPKKYRSLFAKAAEKYGLDPRLLAIVAKHESSFNPKAVSSAGAQGLMQIMPLHGLENPFDPKNNVMFGAQLLASYINGMGSIRKGLAAYNAGPSNHQAGLGYADAILDEWRG